jgi:cytochrome c oxidase cbb3-type subunit I/II
VPYPDGFEDRAEAELQAQAHLVAEGLRTSGFDVTDDREIVALIAYLQRLGTDGKVQTAEVQAGASAAAGGR